MCLAVPARIVELLPDAQALVDLDGVRREISVALVDGLVPGDYVILHVGFALARLDPREAQRTLELFAQAGIVAAREGREPGDGPARDDRPARDDDHAPPLSPAIDHRGNDALR